MSVPSKWKQYYSYYLINDIVLYCICTEFYSHLSPNKCTMEFYKSFVSFDLIAYKEIVSLLNPIQAISETYRYFGVLFL